MGLQRLSHAELLVADLAAEVDFHKSTLGLIELARENGRVFLGCGPGTSYDLSLREGGTGVAQFAFSADHENDLAEFAKTLQEHGVPSESLSDAGPGVEKALQFKLPSGHTAQIVTLAERVHYSNPGLPTVQRTAIGSPLDLDHITLRVGDRAQVTMEFLSNVLGFRASDVVYLPSGEPLATWMHVGDYHHDIAMFKGRPDETLDHLAWTMSGIEHIKLALDCLGRSGRPIESGPGRHGVGGNLYAYFWTPGGNRYELSAEMPRAVDRRAPARQWTDVSKIFSAWGDQMPESFAIGS